MSDSKFDDKIRETLEGHEPEASPNWGKMRDRIAAAAAIGAMGVDAAGSKIATQLSIGAAVVIGAASMWFAQQFVELDQDEEINSIVEEVVSDKDEINPELNEGEVVFMEDEEDDVVKVVSEEKVVRSVEEKARKSEKSNKASTGKDVSKKDKEADIAEKIDEVPITTSAETSCVGTQVSFEVQGSDISKSYLWNFGDGSFSSESNPMHTYKMPGVYDVTLSLRTPGKGSIQTRTIENLITINPQPVAKISWSFPRIITGNKVPVAFIDQTLNANDATWLVDGNIIDSSVSLMDNPGAYQVSLIVSNKFGCQDHSSNIVIIGNRNQLNAPARFSPDGDGRYDSFMPFDLNGMSEKWELVISDKEGEEVYSTTNADKPWKGNNNHNGDLVNDGQEFYWTVVVVSHSGEQRIYTDIVKVER